MKIKHIALILVCLILGIYFLYKIFGVTEKFYTYPYYGLHPKQSWFYPRIYPKWYLWPWWQSTRSTRNMSYDLRGDVPIPTTYIGPWNISSYAPIRNKTLAMIS